MKFFRREIMMETQKIVVIGAGNVGTHFANALSKSGHSIIQVYNRTQKSAQDLVNKLNCSFTDNLKNISTDADLYLFALKDDILQSVIAQIPYNNGIWVHTAGSIFVDIFKDYTDNYGVIYPLQTLSKNRETDFAEIPLFVEGNNKHTENALLCFAKTVSNKVDTADSEKRKYLHLAAVFACNFTNHLYNISTQILDKHNIDWHVLQPLIDETANKLYSISPSEAQTGPAMRNDWNVIERHLSLIENPEIREIYEILSNNIYKNHNLEK
jgi:predicted short-subunit dehydrogenase-like oxidoreductase (DUF2520 family)